MKLPPRGRRPLGCVWNYHRGGWDTAEGLARERPMRPPVPLKFVIRIAPQLKAEHVSPTAQQNVHSLEEESAARRVEDKPAACNNDDPAHKHALWCASSVLPQVPVYYMNEEGFMVQLGKERNHKPHRRPPTHLKRLRRVDVKVWGPDKSRKLEAGEWEMEEQLVLM